jgi:two-component system LytT family sensor kinase
MHPLIYEKLIWITLLIKLGVAAAVSSALARPRTFQNLLFAERRSAPQFAGLLAFLLFPLTLGVLVRTVVPNFLAADIAFESVILIALLFGLWPSVLGGIVLATPAVLHHEYLTLPFNIAVGIVSGFFAQFVDAEEVWSFSPLVDLSLYRWVRRNLRKPRFDRQILLLLLISGMELGREWLAAEYPHQLFALLPQNIYQQLAMFACAAMVVGIPLKIWNTIRLERKLEEQHRLLLEARLDALQRQINPHFLFNTLNSIIALIRSRPELAREMTIKLANILRTLLQERDAYVPLAEELSFTDDYLAIEVVRFGAQQLRVVKDIDPSTLQTLVPSILLQPLIENSIKHGIEPRIQGGTITLRSRIAEGKTIIEIEDDGIGIGQRSANPLARSGAGIGIKNVRERLEVIYGNTASFQVTSLPGQGTRVTVKIPQSTTPA